MVPDEEAAGFTMEVGAATVSEADVIMALLRLASVGDLRKIRLCKNCKERWVFAAKRSYLFCSDKCREMFYVKSPDYHDRKARNQRKYRRQLKEANARSLG